MPKNTLTLWVRGIELTPEQRARLQEKERVANEHNRFLAADAHRRGRLARIEVAKIRAEAFLDKLPDQHRLNHVAAAMLYLGEGAKADGALSFANSNPQIIRYWVYLLRTSFDVVESKFSLQLMTRADQDRDELRQYWTSVTKIERYIKGSVDARTQGKPTMRSDYKGVCSVVYYDFSIRRYLDALAHGLMERSVGASA